jgi:hypothetical protein
MKRIMLLMVSVALMLGLMVALSGAALAQGADVCVSIKGETKVDRGESTYGSSDTSHAVAFDDSKATATNNSFAEAFDCTATAHNGEGETCP